MGIPCFVWSCCLGSLLSLLGCRTERLRAVGFALRPDSRAACAGRAFSGFLLGRWRMIVPRLEPTRMRGPAVPLMVLASAPLLKTLSTFSSCVVCLCVSRLSARLLSSIILGVCRLVPWPHPSLLPLPLHY